MARHFGQNDIQQLLQHLNKNTKSGNEDSRKKSVFPFQSKDVEDLKAKSTTTKNKKRNLVSSVSVEREDIVEETQPPVIEKKRKKKSKKIQEEKESTVPVVEKTDDDEIADVQKETSPKKDVARLERSKQLRASCLEKLMEAQFRNINEYLYSNTSVSALTYMNETLFEKYHEAYRKIVQKWPVKPLDAIIQRIKKSKLHLKKSCTIADMGCGDAELAKHFESLEECKGKVKVHSFDLVSSSSYVTQASIDNVPLDEGTCDVVVFCLSLMGTNVKDYLLEANRILKKDGTLLIAEVASRFEEMSCNKFNQLLEPFFFHMSKVEYLQPKDFFVLFQGKKTDSITKLKGLPYISLKACKYKIR